MNSADDIERSIEKHRLTTSPATDERILADASAALAQAQARASDAGRANVWRMIMRSHWTKLGAAAAAVVAVAALFPIVFDGSAAPAYALEQTIEANRGVRAIHVEFEPAGSGLGELWAQFDEYGELLRLRMDFPNTPFDGPKTVAWQDDKGEIWFKRKKSAVVVREKDMLRRFRSDERVMLFNPRLLVERLYEARAQGKAGIETTEPAAGGEPITLTVTSGEGGKYREVYKVDPETKLLQEFAKYRLKADRHDLTLRLKYLAYNDAVDPNAFTLVIPDDVMRVDQTVEDVGLARGDLSREQIAVSVARQLFEALIAKDYPRAGKVAGGFSGAWIRQKFDSTHFVRIVSIGQPTPAPPETGALRVPCEIELETGGAREVKKYTLSIRPIYGRPGRWAISGGDLF